MLAGLETCRRVEILAVSLRVLTEINNKQLPFQLDIDMVTAFAGPGPDGMGLDEFICYIIRAATEQLGFIGGGWSGPVLRY